MYAHSNVGARIARPPKLWKVCDIRKQYMEDGFHAASQKSRGNVLLSRVFPHVLFPPQAAHMGEPNQVHSLT